MRKTVLCILFVTLILCLTACNSTEIIDEGKDDNGIIEDNLPDAEADFMLGIQMIVRMIFNDKESYYITLQMEV